MPQIYLVCCLCAWLQVAWGKYPLSSLTAAPHRTVLNGKKALMERIFFLSNVSPMPIPTAMKLCLGDLLSYSGRGGGKKISCPSWYERTRWAVCAASPDDTSDTRCYWYGDFLRWRHCRIVTTAGKCSLLVMFIVSRKQLTGNLTTWSKIKSSPKIRHDQSCSRA